MSLRLNRVYHQKFNKYARQSTSIMDPTQPISLKGKDAIAFDKYQKRKATKKEIAFCKRGEEFYRTHLPK